jgi:non-canonical poly(A) RNA polymerase PAPD5/7
MLSLRDPADETNDLGKKGIAIKHVQATLRDLHYHLVRDTNMNTRPSILGSLVGSSYMLQFERRQKLKGYGRSLEQQKWATLAQKAKAVREAEHQTEEKGALNTTNTEKEEALRKEIEEEETKQRLARELKDKEWRRLADERNEWLRNEAAKTLVLEHDDAITSTQDTPAVEEPRDMYNS